MSKLIPSNGLAMNSQEIADMVESRHDSVKRTVDRLANQGVIAHPPTVDVQEVGGNNRTYTTQQYVFVGEKGKRDSIVVVAQLSPEFTARLVDRWQELEGAVHQVRESAEERKRLRHAAASSYKMMSQLLQEKRELEGKPSKPHHFMNEAKLINASITGEFQGIDRDKLSIQELDLLGKIEIRNAILIAQGFTYAARKLQLLAFAATTAQIAAPKQQRLEAK